MKEMLSTCPKIEVYMMTRSEIRWYSMLLLFVLYVHIPRQNPISYFAFQVKEASF